MNHWAQQSRTTHKKNYLDLNAMPQGKIQDTIGLKIGKVWLKEVS